MSSFGSESSFVYLNGGNPICTGTICTRPYLHRNFLHSRNLHPPNLHLHYLYLPYLHHTLFAPELFASTLFVQAKRGSERSEFPFFEVPPPIHNKILRFWGTAFGFSDQKKYVRAYILMAKDLQIHFWGTPLVFLTKKNMYELTY